MLKLTLHCLVKEQRFFSQKSVIDIVGPPSLIPRVMRNICYSVEWNPARAEAEADAKR